MKILLMGPVPPELGSRNPGGVARHVWELAQALRRGGHVADILVLGRYFQFTRVVNEIRLWGIVASMAACWLATRRWLVFEYSSSARRRLKDRLYLLYTMLRVAAVPARDYDILHIHGLSNCAVTACRLLGIDRPIVLTVHSYSTVVFRPAAEQNAVVARINDILRQVDAVIHVSQSDRQRAEKLGAGWTCADAVIHNGITQTGVTHTGVIQAGTTRSGVLFVGSLSAQKGLPELLQAHAKMRTDGVAQPLTIVGTGPLHAEVQRLAQQDHTVRFLGFQPKPVVEQLMAECQVLVVPSRSESFGLVYLEALLRGTPVVGYGPTIREFRAALTCTPAEARFLTPVDVDQLTAGELAAIVQQAARVHDENQAGTVAKAIIGKTALRFGWESAVAQLIDVYQQAADVNRDTELDECSQAA